MEIIELTAEEFITFSQNYPYSLFFQSPYWIKIKEQNGWTGKMVGVKQNGKIVAATVLLMKDIKVLHHKIVYAPRGFLIDYTNIDLFTKFVESLKKYLKKEKAIFLKINPYVKYQERDIDGNIIANTKCDNLIKQLKSLGFIHQGFYTKMDEKKDLEPRWLSVLELENKTANEIFQTMRTTTKRHIRSGEKNCLRIIECQHDDLVEFKSLMQHTADRREFIDRPLSYYENIYKVLSKDKLVKILLVEINFKELLMKVEQSYQQIIEKIERLADNKKKEKQCEEFLNEKLILDKQITDLKMYIHDYGDKKIIAGGLYMLYGRQLVYLFGASYKQFMKYYSQYLLQWQMIQYAIDNNYQTFNFYGIDGDFNKNSKNFGLFDFKRGFGAVVVELIGEFDLAINKPLYYLYQMAYKCYHGLKKIKSRLKK